MEYLVLFFFCIKSTAFIKIKNQIDEKNLDQFLICCTFLDIKLLKVDTIRKTSFFSWSYIIFPAFLFFTCPRVFFCIIVKYNLWPCQQLFIVGGWDNGKPQGVVIGHCCCNNALSYMRLLAMSLRSPCHVSRTEKKNYQL